MIMDKTSEGEVGPDERADMISILKDMLAELESGTNSTSPMVAIYGPSEEKEDDKRLYSFKSMAVFRGIKEASMLHEAVQEINEKLRLRTLKEMVEKILGID